MNLWMMANESLADIRKLEDLAMAADDKLTAEPKNCTAEYETHNEMRLFGPLVARANYLTSYLGVNSTEQYMAEFDRLVQTGKPLALHIDGPGGQVSLMAEFADMIYSAGDQVSAHVSGTATSAHMLLFMAAQGGRTAHYEALIGSMGVIGFVPYKYGDEVVSKRANNKIPDKKIVQKRINGIEQKYLENVAKYTGMTLEAVVKGSDEGAVFSGEEGFQRGFIDELSTYKSISERFTMKTPGKEDNQDSATAFTQADLDKAASDSASARDARWTKMLSHDNASSNLDAVAHFASMPITDQQAFDSLKFGGVAAAPATPAAGGTPDSVAPVDGAVAPVVAEGGLTVESIVAATLKAQRVAAGTNVPAGSDGASHEEEPVEKTQKQKDEAQLDAGAKALKRAEANR